MALPSRSFSTVIIIGAGFSGLAMACKLKSAFGLGDYCIYDRHKEMGGTWYANTYPGCAVDIPAFCYSLSFAPNPDFTRLFPPQAEVLDYFNRVASEHLVYKRFTGQTEWKGASWRDETQTWMVTLEDLRTGQEFTQECRILISAVGGLVDPNDSVIPGLKEFGGHVMHTARWDDNVDLTNKHVVVIGNGASATQLVPAIAGKTKSITQFMRTPHHLVPSRNYDISPEWRAIARQVPGLLYFVRILMFLYMELTFFYFQMTDVGSRGRGRAAESSRHHVLAEAPEKYWKLLTPSYEFGCRRRIFDNGYVASLRRHNMRLTDDPIVRVMLNSILTGSGESVRADVIILATGFALTQYGTPIRGRHGKSRDQHWSELGHKSAYKSTAMHGFPNYFYVLGPNSGRLHTSTVLSIENYVELIILTIAPIIRGEASCVEVKADSERRYAKALRVALNQTVHDSSCSSFLVDKSTGTNWFVYPWNSVRMWLSTHWNVKGDWEYRFTS